MAESSLWRVKRSSSQNRGFSGESKAFRICIEVGHKCRHEGGHNLCKRLFCESKREELSGRESEQRDLCLKDRMNLHISFVGVLCVNSEQRRLQPKSFSLLRIFLQERDSLR